MKRLTFKLNKGGDTYSRYMGPGKDPLEVCARTLYGYFIFKKRAEKVVFKLSTEAFPGSYEVESISGSNSLFRIGESIRESLYMATGCFLIQFGSGAPVYIGLEY